MASSSSRRSPDSRSGAGGIAGNAARRPVWWGILLTVVAWAALAIPMFWALLAAAVGFTGCFIECSAPDPGIGMFGVTALAVMAAAPVLAGIALVRRSRGWWIAAACAAALIVVPIAVARLTGAA
ncbi:hypothetical protein LVY72_12955 [Arthrobacter sp. I2-34]|uniref:Uncharacterized protein n=1 Tax=Arthrobacter hankyongi TaxID=2904801 RepID=A0ABS9L816_9MICC|nr:hypothetical protein [Arthrobacter hankyongi]MCG2622810.1 hypothetical protein [Arthrobacter hankyongi]